MKCICKLSGCINSSARNCSYVISLFLFVVLFLHASILALPSASQISPLQRRLPLQCVQRLRNPLLLRGGSQIELQEDENSNETVEVCLVSNPLSTNSSVDEALSRLADVLELLEQGKKLKDEGNSLHAAEQFSEAAAKYEAARTLLLPKHEDPAVSALEQSCSLNLASCHLKLKNFSAAEAACTNVLAMDHSNFKALYRRGIARLSMVSNHTDSETSPADNVTCIADGDGGRDRAGPSQRKVERTLEQAFGDLLGAWAVAPWDPAVAAALQDLRASLFAHGLHARVAELDAAVAPSTSAFAGAEEGRRHTEDAELLEAAAARLRSDPKALRAALSALRAAKPATLAAYLRGHPLSTSGERRARTACGQPGEETLPK